MFTKTWAFRNRIAFSLHVTADLNISVLSCENTSSVLLLCCTALFWIQWCQAGANATNCLVQCSLHCFAVQMVDWKLLTFRWRILLSCPPAPYIPLLRGVRCEIHLPQIPAESLSSHSKDPLKYGWSLYCTCNKKKVRYSSTHIFSSVSFSLVQFPMKKKVSPGVLTNMAALSCWG